MPPLFFLEVGRRKGVGGGGGVTAGQYGICYVQALNSDNPRMVYSNLEFNHCAHNSRIACTIPGLPNELREANNPWINIHPAKYAYSIGCSSYDIVSGRFAPPTCRRKLASIPIVLLAVTCTFDGRLLIMFKNLPQSPV